MAQIGSTFQSHGLHVYQMNRVGFKCRSTLMNPAMSCFSASNQPMKSTTEKTRTHLSNLEKLLQIKEVAPQPVIKPIEPPPNTGQGTDNSGGRKLLEKLNLTGIWPEGIPGRAAEVAAEMSPNRLTRLQRLLSQPEYSPRNQLGARWREYHGSRDWAGLLDPLDENLRREMVRYGEFVQAAYQSFHADPGTTKEGINAWRDVKLPDKSYRVTKSLYATSSVGLPKWVDDVAPDLGWMTQRSSMIGYVAVCHDEREIARMGRRDIVIALRGTSTCLEWAENLRESLVPMQDNVDSKDQAKVECGFNSLFRTKGEHVPSLADSIVQEIERLISTYKGETLSISITGHSLGAALSLLAGNEINTRIPNAPQVAVFSFGGPRVGNRAFGDHINANNVKVLRIVNKHDLFTRVPGMFLNEETEQQLKSNPHVAGAIQWLDNMPWSYSHVGTELKVDTRTSPYLKPDADMACNHDLEAYLHLVDGFLSTNCPFRPNAKRSLLKLLSEQGANVKKLYRSKSKAKSLTLKVESGGIVSSALSLSRSSSILGSPSLQHE
ncbi:phospholipase A1-Ibeta2, chloroplastic-like [Silene latifolia]|uniref:phospholipase A1-Ibeta2, chloroplastic-like n=1 Tax=Silene latifolia TaxID=37657 RepID=UPI003D78685C